jgi:hypothetical protein
MLQSNRGVTQPVNQGRPANEGTPNSVVSVAKAEFVVVEYFDGEGRRTRDALVRVGSEYYTAPNSQAWAEGLKSVRPWLRDGIRKKLPHDGPVAATDVVDIL